MGKISDIWVRLGLKKNEFDKGMDDAVKKTEKAGSKMSSVLSAAKAGWAAVGAAVIAFGNEMIKATNLVGDAWGRTMGGVQSAWQQMLANFSNIDWKELLAGAFNVSQGFKNIFTVLKGTDEAAKAGKEMADAFDAEFELVNSVKIQRAKISGELADLQVEMRNAALSPEARMAAIDRYKALLEPLYEAEIEVRKNMLDAAVKNWMAGTGASATTQEVVDFFTRIGTDAAAAIADHPVLAKIYNERKGDKANQVIFDAITTLAQAESGLANELKMVNRTANSLMALMETTSRLDLTMPSVDALTTTAVSQMPSMTSAREWLDEYSQIGLEAVEKQAEWISIMEQGAMMLEQTLISSLGNGLQAITDLMFGLDGASAKNILSAFMAPFGDFAKQMGSMIMSYGLSMDAFKKAFANPYVAIAAGAGLMAIGAAISSGAQKLSTGSLSGSPTSSYGGSSYNNELNNYESTLTVYVEGRISGSDIIIAGTNQQNKWNR